MRKEIVYFLTGSLLFLVNVLRAQTVEGNKTVLWSYESGKPSWKSPALVRTPDGTLLAFATHDINGKGIGGGDCDIDYRVSVDNGKTWSDSKVLLNGTSKNGYALPAVAVDAESGDVMLMCSSGNIAFTSCTSKKHIGFTRIEGKNRQGTIEWEESPTDVTKSFYNNVTLGGTPQGAYFTPGSIIQSRLHKYGTHYRLFATADAKMSSTLFNTYILYSDDFGKTWKSLHKTLTSYGGEAVLSELPDGDLLVSFPKKNYSTYQGWRVYRIMFMSDPSTPKYVWGMDSGVSVIGSDRGTKGDLLVLNVKTKEGVLTQIALQTKPAMMTNGIPQKLTCYYTKLTQEDVMDSYTCEYLTNAFSTEQSFEITTGNTAGSTLCLLPDNRIGIVYEDNYAVTNGKQTSDVIFDSFSISELTHGDYTEVVNELVMNEKESFQQDIDMLYDKVSINRTDMTSERYYTLCLPFSLTMEEAKTNGLKRVETLNSYDAESGTLYFSELSAQQNLKAYRPYLVYAKPGALQGFQKKNCFVSRSVDEMVVSLKSGARMVGNFTEGMDMKGKYGYSAVTGQFARGGEGSKLHSCCAYIDLPATQQAKSIEVVLEGDEENIPTNIHNILIEGKAVDVYSIDGRFVQRIYCKEELSSLPPGVYLIGKRVFVR